MRKRSKYRPKPQYANPVERALENVRPITKHEHYVIELKTINMSALAALMKGEATSDHINVLIGMHNIAEAMMKNGVGPQFGAITDASFVALKALVARRERVGKFVPTGPELQALKDLLELHDAQLDAGVSVQRMEEILKGAKKGIDTSGVDLRPKLMEGTA